MEDVGVMKVAAKVRTSLSTTFQMTSGCSLRFQDQFQSCCKLKLLLLLRLMLRER